MTLAEKIGELPSYEPEGQFAVTIGTMKPTEDGQWLSKQHVIDAIGKDEAITAKNELAKTLFTEKPNATWEDIQGEVEAITEQFTSIRATFKRINREIDGIDLDGETLEDQAGSIYRKMEEDQDTINELKEQIETLENADQTLAAIELFHDLGFDTSRLLINNKLDFSNPDVLYNLKNQLQRMKP